MKTLDLINQAREAFAIEPLAELPKGERNTTRACPIAQALKEIDPDVYINFDYARFDTMATAAEVGRVWGIEASGHAVDLPLALKQFIGRFDNGHYKKYERAEASP